MSKRAAKKLAAGIEAGDFCDGPMPMTPDRRIQWKSHLLPDDLGIVFLPLSHNPEVAERLAFLALHPEVIPGDRRGNCGVVGFAGNLAIKSFRYNNAAQYALLPGLQANIALHAGIVQNAPVVDGWRFDAPEQYGALLRPTIMGSAVWFMQRMFGDHPSGELLDAIPSKDVVKAVCQEAVGAFGILPGVIATDNKPENSLVGPDGQSPRDFIKLDVFVSAGLRRAYSLVH